MDQALRAELLAMVEKDLAMRRALIESGELFDGYHPKMAAVHRENNARLAAIVEQVGWPGISLVGEDGCEAAWKIAQHAILDPELQRACIELLRRAVETGEAPAWQLAMLTDRVQFDAGEPQVYGSILVEGEDGLVPWTIANPEQVDARRSAAGLPPLAEHVRRVRERHAREERIHQAAKNARLGGEDTSRG
jgi:hypothetical protein